MRAYVGVTDGDWFRLLASQPDLEEINFWQPGGNRSFGAISPGELFLFKLHAPARAIVGGGFFIYSTLSPVSLAWEAFGIGNGATSLMEMRHRIEKYRRDAAKLHEDYKIGCILLSQPFFLRQEEWIEEPADWHPNIVQGKTYSSDSIHGRRLIQQVHDAIGLHGVHFQIENGEGSATGKQPRPRYGSLTTVRPRLGQGAFRMVVSDAYSFRCAVSGERVLPALEAVHIRPYEKGGLHEIKNGLLLRADIHKLFDKGYLTVTPKHNLEVSKRIHEEYENGKEYYALHGRKILLPKHLVDAPTEENLQWHNENIFAG